MKELVHADRALAEVRNVLVRLNRRSVPAAKRLPAAMDSKSEVLRTNPFVGRGGG